MEAFAFLEGAIEIDASIVADGLKMPPAAILQAIREGTVTSRCERGVDADAGRYRLTFYSKYRRFRVVIDARGAIVSRSSLDFGGVPLPRAARRPGA